MVDIKYYRKMKRVERLGLSFTHRSYNLLEHSYMVGMLFRHFASKENVAYDIHVLDLVLNHDLLEVETSDLITTVKKCSTKTEEAWDIIENEILNKHPQLERYSDKKFKDGMTPLQHKLFKVCDYLDLWIFLKEEISIGNRSKDIMEIFERCTNLIGNDFLHVVRFMETYEC